MGDFPTAQLVATVIAIYTDWEFTRIKGVGWKCAGITHFAAVITRIRDPKTTALIFASGKMLAQMVREMRESKAAHTIQVLWSLLYVLMAYSEYLKRISKDEDKTELFRLRFFRKCRSQNAVAYAFKGKCSQLLTNLTHY
ncbi:plasma membrane ATPase 4-like protein [Tanacetum coccineum]